MKPKSLSSCKAIMTKKHPLQKCPESPSWVYTRAKSLSETAGPCGSLEAAGVMRAAEAMGTEAKHVPRQLGWASCSLGTALGGGRNLN